MAKQNVGFGERHLEKMVVGVAGAVLAAMLFLYVVQDPYSIQVGGQTFGPNAFYPRLDEQATQMLNALKQAQPKELEPPWNPPPPPSQRAAADLPVVIAQIHPPVPQADSRIDRGGTVELVGIMAPGKPVATSGRAYATVPNAQVISIGESQRNVESTPGASEDCNWVAVFATVNRGAQHEAFRKANYAVSLLKLVVTEVEAERQRLLPDGDWSPSERVARPFNLRVLSGKKSVELKVQDGETYIEEEDYRFINMFQDEALKAQADILRPPFQGILPEESRLDWVVPAEMPDGAKFDWVQDYGVTIAAPAGSIGVGGPTVRIDFRRTKAEIEDLTRQRKFVDALAKVNEALAAGQNLPPNHRQELAALAEQLEQPAQQEEERLAAARVLRLSIEEANLGPDTDLLWVTDLSAVPGETYRYRVRLSALNLHAGQLRKLRSAQDAAKVVLTGEWSEWSDPVPTKQVKQVFVTSVNSDESLRVEFHQWAGGQWEKINPTMNLGQPMTFQERLKDFSYDAVPALLDTSALWEERSVNRQGNIRYDTRQTTAIVFIRSDGQIEEHLLLDDVKKRRDFTNELSAPKDVRQAITPSSGGGGVGRPGPRAPARGGGRFRDDF